METRIYLVTDKAGADKSGTGNARTGRFLVRAASQAQAVRHVVKARFACEVADQDVLVEALTAGLRVEVAGE